MIKLYRNSCHCGHYKQRDINYYINAEFDGTQEPSNLSSSKETRKVSTLVLHCTCKLNAILAEVYAL